MKNNIETFDNLEFILYYIPVTLFKQKHYNIVTSTIRQSRLFNYMQLIGPGEMYFEEDDTRHAFPKVNLMEAFNRNKTNCLIYKLPYNAKNDEMYDYLFVYYSEMGKVPYYGYLAYNESTNKCSHRYLINGDYNDLTKALNEFFNVLFDSDKYEFFSKKHDSLHQKNGLTLDDCPTIKDYKQMLTYKDERINKYSKINILI